MAEDKLKRVVEDPIGRALIHVTSEYVSTVDEEVVKMLAAGERMTVASLIELTVRSVYSSALHVGIALAIADVQQARRLSEWLFEVMLDADPKAGASVMDQVEAWESVL